MFFTASGFFQYNEINITKYGMKRVCDQNWSIYFSFVYKKHRADKNALS